MWEGKMKKLNKNELEILKKLIRTKGQEFLDLPEVTSVGIGEKITKGKSTGKIAIQITVDKKFEEDQLENLGRTHLPKTIEFEGTEWETDIIERTYSPGQLSIDLTPKQIRRTHQDPIFPGISVCNVSGTAGTIGSIVYDKKTAEPHILSNWHVLNGSDGEIGDPIVQPGPFDDNSDVEENIIGMLVRSHLGVAADCAIASIENRDFDSRVFELDVIPMQFSEVTLGDKLIKSGRTTGVTHGIVRRIFVTAKINYGGNVGAVKVGGFEIGIDPDFPAELNEISMGGDSGSLWLFKDNENRVTDNAAGLHFAGEGSSNPDEHALACYIHNVLEKLQVTFNQEEAIRLADPEALATGYDENFIPGYVVKHPVLMDQAKHDALKVNGDCILNYTHYSLVMNKKRRTACYTAANIDGRRMVRLPRKDEWRFDTRIDEKYQMGNDIYKNNPWDKGHLVRRLDAQWGTVREAKKGRSDSYYYSNAAPQHKNFNQDEWVYLEDWILEKTSENYYRLCVFTGPIFTDNDQKYRGIRIPGAFWKVIAMRRDSDENLTALAFLMNQYEMLQDSNGRKYLNLTLYQVPISEIERHTHLDFQILKENEPESISEMVVPEGLEIEPYPIIKRLNDIIMI
jgi:endonuclease G